MLASLAAELSIDANRGLLEDQARAFYTGIIGGIDDQTDFEFEFEG